MNIIIATHDIKDEAISKPLANAFKSLGHKADVFYTEYSMFGFRLPYQPHGHLMIFYPFIRMAIALARARLQGRILKEMRDKKPDLLIVIKGKHVAIDTIEKIKNLGIKTANWFPDGMWNIGTLRRITPHYDAMFVMDPNCREELNKDGNKSIYYLPMAAFRTDNYDIEDILKHKEYDISFVGILASHKEREDILGRLKRFNLKIWGTPEWSKSSLRDFYQGSARGNEMLEIYRRSKIVVNIHVGDQKTQGPNLRSFEAMISGALVISDYKNGLAELFKDRSEIVYFKNPEDLPSLVKYYLSHDSEREQITRNGYQEVVTKHTMNNRAKTIMDSLFS